MYGEAVIYESRQYRREARIPRPDESAPRPTRESTLALDVAFLLFSIAAIAVGVAFAF